MERHTAIRMRQVVIKNQGGVNYNSPKFLKAARRQAKTMGAGGSSARSFLKVRSGSASRYSKG